MGKEEIIPIIIIILVIGAAFFYIIKAKKSGRKCIGCPSSGTCGKSKNQGCSCGCHKE